MVRTRKQEIQIQTPFDNALSPTYLPFMEHLDYDTHLSCFDNKESSNLAPLQVRALTPSEFFGPRVSSFLSAGGGNEGIVAHG